MKIEFALGQRCQRPEFRRSSEQVFGQLDFLPVVSCSLVVSPIRNPSIAPKTAINLTLRCDDQWLASVDRIHRGLSRMALPVHPSLSWMSSHIARDVNTRELQQKYLHS